MKGLFTLGLLVICWQLTVKRQRKKTIQRQELQIQGLKFEIENLTKIISEYEKNKIRSDDKGGVINP
jgi:hypothetical protein